MSYSPLSKANTVNDIIHLLLPPVLLSSGPSHAQKADDSAVSLLADSCVTEFFGDATQTRLQETGRLWR